jgi:hypothetical protein
MVGRPPVKAMPLKDTFATGASSDPNKAKKLARTGTSASATLGEPSAFWSVVFGMK